MKFEFLSFVQNILEHDPLHKSLFALCVEIVLFSYNSQSRWVNSNIYMYIHHCVYRHIKINTIVCVSTSQGIPMGVGSIPNQCFQFLQAHWGGGEVVQRGVPQKYCQTSQQSEPIHNTVHVQSSPCNIMHNYKTHFHFFIRLRRWFSTILHGNLTPLSLMPLT